MSYGTVPTPPSPIPYLPPQKHWFSRNWKWFVPVAVLGSVLLFALVIGGLLSLVFGFIRSSEPYKHAVAVVMTDPLAVQALGRPIKVGIIVSGNINIINDSGSADLAIPVHGSAHSGKVYVIAKKSAGVWRYEKLQLWIDGQPGGLDLLQHSTVPPVENP
jgi:hypothetical protein